MSDTKTDVIYEDFGKRLLELRIASGYSQEDVVKLIQTNVSLRSYQEYENGHSLPSAETLISFSKFFNVSIDYLLFNSCRKKPKRTWGNKLLSLIDLMADYIVIPIQLDKAEQFEGKRITGVFISIDPEIEIFLKKYNEHILRLLNKQEYNNSSVLIKLAESQLGKPLRNNRKIYPFDDQEYLLAKQKVDSINNNIERKYVTKEKRFKR